jgi:hypothetical protein
VRPGRAAHRRGLTVAAPHAQALGEPQALLLQPLGIRSAHWVETVTHYRRHFFTMVGTVQRMTCYCARIDRTRAKGTQLGQEGVSSAA